MCVVFSLSAQGRCHRRREEGEEDLISHEMLVRVAFLLTVNQGILCVAISANTSRRVFLGHLESARAAKQTNTAQQQQQQCQRRLLLSILLHDRRGPICQWQEKGEEEICAGKEKKLVEGNTRRTHNKRGGNGKKLGQTLGGLSLSFV